MILIVIVIIIIFIQDVHFSVTYIVIDMYPVKINVIIDFALRLIKTITD